MPNVLALRVDLIQHHICVRFVAGGESDDFVVFAHPFEKGDGIRTNGDVGVSSGAVFYFNRELEIVGAVRIFFAVKDSFIDINDECLLAYVLLIYWQVYLLLF